MINIIFYKRKRNRSLKGINVSGHAEYDEPGRDIICAAVSTLTINLINSIEQLTDTKWKFAVDDGFIDMSFPSEIDDDCMILVESYFLGIESIIEAYGSSFIKIETKEV